MWLELVLRIVAALGISAALWVVARALPRLDETKVDSAPGGELARDLMNRLEKVDEWLDYIKEKILRKIRVFVLKVENWVNTKLAKEEKREGFKDFLVKKEKDEDK
jgi:hypothetical protein